MKKQYEKNPTNSKTAIPRSQVLLNFKIPQLGWIKTK